MGFNSVFKGLRIQPDSCSAQGRGVLLLLLLLDQVMKYVSTKANGYLTRN